MRNSTEHRDTEFTLWLEFEHWIRGPEDDPENNFFNMKISLASGRSYALNVWTFKFLERAIHAIRFEKQIPKDLSQVGFAVQHPLEREYLLTPDLLVTRLDRELIEQIVAHMLRQYDGQLPSQWECPPPLEPE